MSNSYRNTDRKKYMDGAGVAKGKPKGEQKMKSEQRRAERALRIKDISVLVGDELDEDDYPGAELESDYYTIVK